MKDSTMFSLYFLQYLARAISTGVTIFGISLVVGAGLTFGAKIALDILL